MKTVKKADFLEVFPAFKDAPDSPLLEILAYGRPTKFEKDRRIFQENDKCGAVGFFSAGGCGYTRAAPRVASSPSTRPAKEMPAS